jgi:hypothetical protein
MWCSIFNCWATQSHNITMQEEGNLISTREEWVLTTAAATPASAATGRSRSSTPIAIYFSRSKLTVNQVYPSLYMAHFLVMLRLETKHRRWKVGTIRKHHRVQPSCTSKLFSCKDRWAHKVFSGCQVFASVKSISSIDYSLPVWAE